ncbi:unnamed protein product [Didymodactylos carnosus]|uniref:SF4 helicase domain-containing protein n=1 Tax=Didymodactylos carnosus TaxID=1234261 RepID=A0A813YPB9_9BILA|nr:unnamed protein product [Didymodactylos carnosus]CAF0915133.1 unnamed protein product [Didymodactylos carnosus]CAF3671922.1 unnamed protein product [Didymodactylos carnosus]CAF3693544.1 unnamed protein product [Didymodactylos carnosus]
MTSASAQSQIKKLTTKNDTLTSFSTILDRTIEIKEYLRKTSTSFDETWTCIKCYCCTSLKKDSGIIHISKVKGEFFCSKCLSRGSWEDFQNQLESIKIRKTCPKEKLKHVLPDDLNEIWKKAKILTELQKDDDLHAILANYGFVDHVLSIASLHKYGIKLYEDKLIAPLFDADRVSLIGIVQLDASNVTQQKLNTPFGLNILTQRNSEAIIVDNIWDALCLYEITGKAAIVLPNSKLSIQTIVLLENLRKLQIWCTEKVLAFRLATILNPHRCYIVSHPVSAQTAFKNGENVRSIVKDSFAVINKCIQEFKSLREEVLAEMMHATKLAGIQWQRFPQLTQILKGHRRGELTVLTGPTGSGKTTFLSEYSLDLCMQGVSTLFGSFEIQAHRLAKIMLTQYSGLNLSKNLHVFEQYANLFEQLPMYFMTFHGQENIDKVIETMANAVTIHNIEHVVIDNLQFMLVIHPRKEAEEEELAISSIFGTAKASQESDNILIIQNRKLPNATGYMKYLQVGKNRFDGELGKFQLRFDRDRLSFSRLRKDIKSDEVIINSSESKDTSVTESLAMLTKS